MDYEAIALACERLDYRDKLRLAQLLIQTARKEEENLNPQERIVELKHSVSAELVEQKEINTISYVYERLIKLRPSRVKTLNNSIKSMFQFQGGISEPEVDEIVNKLQQKKLVRILNNKVEYDK